MSAPDVTTVIPTRNRSDFLRDALRSVLEQRGVELEVVVVDDASATPVDLSGLDDRRVRVIRFDQNVGQSAARNAGVAAAEAPWVAFLDDDDLWAPDKLRRQLDAAQAADATWAYCGVLLFSDDGGVTPMWGPPSPEGLVDQLLRRNVVQAGASTVVARADRVRAVGGFDTTLGPLSDRDLWIRLALDGPAAAVEEPLAAYRRHGDTLIGRSKRRTLLEADRVAARYAQLAQERGVVFDREHLDAWLTSERVRSLRYSAAAARRGGHVLRALRLQAGAFRLSRARSDARVLAGLLLGDRSRDYIRRRLGESSTQPSAHGVPAWLAAYIEGGRA